MKNPRLTTTDNFEKEINKRIELAIKDFEKKENDGKAEWITWDKVKRELKNL